MKHKQPAEKPHETPVDAWTQTVRDPNTGELVTDEATINVEAESHSAKTEKEASNG